MTRRKLFRWDELTYEASFTNSLLDKQLNVRLGGMSTCTGRNFSQTAISVWAMSDG